jgi:hypothetical protein
MPPNMAQDGVTRNGPSLFVNESPLTTTKRRQRVPKDPSPLRIESPDVEAVGG